jgi:hypothetical protein
MPIGPNLGYKLFTTGAVLTASQVQQNLANQSVLFYASAAARDADTALTAALTEGMFCYLADTNITAYYSGSAWVPLFQNQVLTSPRETVQVVATPGATGTVTIETQTSSVELLQTAATANWTTNVTGSVSPAVTLNSIMAVGEQISAVLLNTNGATAYYPTAFQIDGSAVTPKWLGGTAPASGNINSVDAYVYTIIKTAASTYTVLASQNKFA